MKVECGIVSCRHNKNVGKKYGLCECPRDLVLKWRAAVDFGQGSMVMVECLNLELPDIERTSSG